MNFYNFGEGHHILCNDKSFFSEGCGKVNCSNELSGNSSNDLGTNPSANFSANLSNSALPDYESSLKAYLKKYTFDLNKIGFAKRILVVEEDNRIQKVLQRLIQEENAQALCVFGETVDDVLQLHKEHHFDLVVANCYEADDEVDYDFWDELREENPQLDVIILSHVNDREYYDMLGKLEALETKNFAPLTAKLKNFFENVFGGRNGNH